LSIPNDNANFDDGDLMFHNPTFNLGLSNSGVYMDDDMGS